MKIKLIDGQSFIIHNAVIAVSVPKIYIDNTLTKTLDVSLTIDNVIKVICSTNANGEIVKVILPDGTVGFIHPEEPLYLIELGWATHDMKIYSNPNNEDEYTILNKGEQFETYGMKEEWARIKVGGKNIIEALEKYGDMREQATLTETEFKKLKQKLLAEDSTHIKYISGSVEIATESSIFDAIIELLDEDTSRKEVIKQLSKVAPAEYIASLYDQILTLREAYAKTPEGKKELTNAALKTIGFGSLWIIGGVVATSISMGNGGDTYTVWYGACLYGGWLVLVGVWRLIKSSI